MPRRLRNLADGAALLDLPNAEAVALAAALAAAPPAGFLDAVPGACTLLLLFFKRRSQFKLLTGRLLGGDWRCRGHTHRALRVAVASYGRPTRRSDQLDVKQILHRLTVPP